MKKNKTNNKNNKNNKSMENKKSKQAKETDWKEAFNTETPAEKKEQNKKAMEDAGKFMPYFNLGDGETAIIAFLDNKPVTFYQHRVWDKSAKKGVGGYRTLTCPRKSAPCALCKKGDKPRYVGAYRIVHIDNIETVRNKQGKEVEKQVPREEIFIKGVNTLAVIERKETKLKEKGKHISDKIYEVERVGTGFDTVYTFDETSEVDIPEYKEAEEDDLKEIFAVQLDVINRIAGTLFDDEDDDPDDVDTDDEVDDVDNEDEDEDEDTDADSDDNDEPIRKSKKSKRVSKNSDGDSIPF